MAERTHDLRLANQNLRDDIRARLRVERYARSLFAQAAVGMAVLDCAGTVREINARMAEMLGRTDSELRGKIFPLLEVADDESSGMLMAMGPDGEHLPLRREIYLQRADGEMRWFYVTLSSLSSRGTKTGDTLAVVEDITERKRAEAELGYLAYHDALTGLPNRTLFIDRAEQAIAHAARTDGLLAVLYLDLDNFKVINDSLGHDMGDRLMRTVAERLQNAVRSGDTIARLGGDEFAVLLSGIGRPEDAGGVSSNLLETIRKPVRLSGHDVVPTMSIGISLFPSDGQDLGSLLSRADAAMYEAKRLGRNRIGYSTEQLSRDMLERLRMEGALRLTVEQQEFRLEYQPQVDLGSERVVGMEALLRWTHSEEGPVAPYRFIPLLEQTGLIVQVTGWILGTACREAVRWQRAGRNPVAVAVNISSRQLREPGLIEQIEQALDESGLAPELLELELTESLVMDEVEASSRILGDAKRLGVKIAVDDFGTGYSSLAYLNTLPLDILKVDKSFVTNLKAGSTEQNIAGAVVALAHSLGMTVVAEGIETAEQLELLRAMGCDLGQGYFWARPLTPDRAGRFLNAR